MGFGEYGRCMGCMEILDWDGKCSYCGFDKSTYRSDSHYLPPGTLLKNGDYMVGRVLGEGGFGITYIGLDQNLLNRVAIKEYYPTGLAARDVSEGDYGLRICGGDAESDYRKGLTAFVEEARTLAKFNGMEGIVNVRYFFQENETAYIIMEYIDGISVRRYVQQHGRIEPQQVLGMMEQPMRALHAVHEKQLVHRDVSADNFMISKNGKVTLIDFGAARYSNALDEKTRTAICKQGFSALEQYSGGGKQGAWTDVYSICATMYYMLTGIIPESSTERILDDRVVSLDQIPEIQLGIEQKRAIMMGMAVRRDERFQNMEFLYQAVYGKMLSGCLGGNVALAEEEKLPVHAGESENLQNKVSPTAILRELLQFSDRRKRKKRTVKIAKGTVSVVLLLLLLLAFERYIGFAEQDKNVNQINLTSKKTNAPSVTPEITPEVINAPNGIPKITPEVTNAPKATPGITPKVINASKATPEVIAMPEVAGLKRGAAIKRLTKKGLSYRVILRESSISAGTVIRASVAAGKDVSKGKKIVLYVSKGKKKVKVKVTPVPVVTRAPEVTKAPLQKTPEKSKEQDNLAGDLDSFIY